MMNGIVLHLPGSQGTIEYIIMQGTGTLHPWVTQKNFPAWSDWQVVLGG